MDAGVPLAAPVAGMAMGLVMNEENGKFAVLSDIAGAEDHYGDMDFKVAGTGDGHHRPADGHQGRRHHHGDHAPGARAGPPGPALHPRQDGRDARRAAHATSPLYAPRIVTIKIPVDKIRDVIGPGGKMIRSIIERTGVQDRRRGRRPRQRRVERRGVGAQGDRDHPGADRDRRAQQDLHGQGRSASPTSARSSRSCPASTACSTSRRSPTTASRTCATSSRKANRSWSR